jgi:hypothetical protein
MRQLACRQYASKMTASSAVLKSCLMTNRYQNGEGDAIVRQVRPAILSGLVSVARQGVELTTDPPGIGLTLGLCFGPLVVEIGDLGEEVDT